MRYRRPSRLRRIAKLVGLAVCVFLTTAWAVSTIYQFAVTRRIIPRIQIATGPPMYWARCDSLFMGRITINGLAVTVNQGWEFMGPVRTNQLPHNFGFVLPYFGKIATVPGLPARLTVVIPMWLPLVVFAIPTAHFWYRDRRPPKGCYRVHRLSRRSSLLIAGIVFFVLFVLTSFAIEAIATPTIRSDFISATGSSETLSLAILLLLTLSIPYLAARWLFSLLRWQTLSSDEPLCLHCGYNLTGNESGVCPECSTPVPKQETTA